QPQTSIAKIRSPLLRHSGPLRSSLAAPLARNDRCGSLNFVRPRISPSERPKPMTTIAASPPVISNRLADWASRNGPVFAIFATIFALWEAAVRALGVPDYILPSPLVIAAKIVASWQLLLVTPLSHWRKFCSALR